MAGLGQIAWATYLWMDGHHFYAVPAGLVGVSIGNRKVGYLSRNDAYAFRDAYEGKAAVIVCDAKIIGGWKGCQSEGSYCLRLNVRT